MESQTRICCPTAVRHYWHRWTEVVGWFALQRVPRRRIDPGEYQALHTTLMRACQSGTLGKDERGQSYCEKLEGLARPWMTARALAQAEMDILFDLYRRCREIDRELNGPRFSDLLGGWVRLLLLAVFVAGLITLLAGTREWFLNPLLDTLDGWWRAFRFAVKHQLSD